MIIQNTNFSILYPRINNLRRKFVEHEDKLSEYFLPYNILPIPDDAPEEIPRIIMATKNGHSNLQISLNAMMLNTNYDNVFQNNWDACLDYLKKRVNNIYEILQDTLKQDKFLFTGLTTQMIFDNINENPIKLINDRLLNIKVSKEPFDLNCKLTFVYEENYYINITFMNMRFYEGTVALGNDSLAKLKEKAHNLGIILDVNDRYGFNYKEGYTSNYSKVENVFEITTDIIKNKIDKFIKEGVFEL